MTTPSLGATTRISENNTKRPTTYMDIASLNRFNPDVIFHEMAGAGCGQPFVAEHPFIEKFEASKGSTTSSENQTQPPLKDQSFVIPINNRTNQLFREMAGGGCGEPVAVDPLIEKFDASKG